MPLDVRQRRLEQAGIEDERIAAARGRQPLAVPTPTAVRPTPHPTPTPMPTVVPRPTPAALRSTPFPAFTPTPTPVPRPAAIPTALRPVPSPTPTVVPKSTAVPMTKAEEEEKLLAARERPPLDVPLSPFEKFMGRTEPIPGRGRIARAYRALGEAADVGIRGFGEGIITLAGDIRHPSRLIPSFLPGHTEGPAGLTAMRQAFGKFEQRHGRRPTAQEKYDIIGRLDPTPWGVRGAAEAAGMLAIPAAAKARASLVARGFGAGGAYKLPGIKPAAARVGAELLRPIAETEEAAEKGLRVVGGRIVRGLGAAARARRMRPRAPGELPTTRVQPGEEVVTDIPTTARPGAAAVTERVGEIAISEEMMKDGQKLSQYMWRTGRQRGMTPQAAENINALQSVRTYIRWEKKGTIGGPSRPGAPSPGAEMRVLPGVKENTGLPEEFSSWATKAGLSNVDPQYARDALWLYEAKRVGLDPTGLVRKYPDSFPTAPAPATARAAEDVTTAKGDVRLYRGQVQGGQGRYYSTDKDFARAFTQSGRESEISEIVVPASRVYRGKELPFAKDVDAIDKTLIDARAKGYDAIWVDEGLGQPPSVLFAVDDVSIIPPTTARPGAAPVTERAADVPITPAAARPPAAPAALTRAQEAAAATEEGVQGIVPPSAVGAQNIIGLRPIEAGLKKTQELLNTARRIVGKPFRAVLDEPNVAGALRERARVRPAIESQSNRLGAVSGERVRRVFVVDETGRIPALAGVDSGVPGAPTIQDVAARLPRYAERLTPEQRTVMSSLQQEVGPYRNLLDEVGIEVPSRSDVVEGGFYLPRGRAGIEGVDDPIKITAGRSGRGKPGFERPAVFDSMAEGVEKGYEYPALGEALSSYSADAGYRATDQHVANFLSEFGTTPADRIDPALRSLIQTLRAKISSRIQTQRRQAARTPAERQALRDINRIADAAEKRRMRSAALLSRRATRRAEGVGSQASEVVLAETERELDVLTNIVTKMHQASGKAVARVDRTTLKSRQTSVGLDDLRDELNTLRGRWSAAQRKAQATPRESGVIPLRGLESYAFPDELANAANKILRNEGPIYGQGSSVLRVIRGFLNLYRGVTATADNSAPGIQGLLGWYSDPKAASKALKLNFLAWADEKVLGKFIVDFDDAARAAGTPTSSELSVLRLRIGGPQTEFELGGRTSFGRLPLVKQANRAFGFFGDGLRLSWARDEFLREMRRGRTVQEIISSGDGGRIVDAVNSMTGWSQSRTFGQSVGDLVLYAPRFFQSRLETLARAALSARPNASMEQRIARRSMLKMIAYGTLLTVAANEALGNETDFRPIVNGRKNPNFMRIRVAGRDWSLFGTWDSIAGALISVAGGKPHEALRGVGSGLVSLGWDLLSGADFIGRRVRDDPAQFAMWILRSFSPFAAEELPQAAKQIATGVAKKKPLEALAGAAVAGGEVFAVKSAPLSFTDVADEVTREKDWGKYFRDLEPFLKNEVKEDPRVEEVANRRQGSPYFTERARLDDEMDARIAEVEEDKVKKRNKAEAVNAYFEITREFAILRNRLALDTFGESEFDKDEEDPNKRALAEYYKAFDDAKTPAGNFDTDKYNKLLAELNSKWKKEGTLDYVLANTHMSPVPRKIMNALKLHANKTWRAISASEAARERRRALHKAARE